MSTIEKRIALLQLIEQADEAFIEAAHLLLTGQHLADEDPITSYDIDGTPRTASELTTLLDEEVAAAKRGEYITIEEFKAQSAQWSQATK